MIRLRPYQSDAHAGVLREFDTSDSTLVKLPTGTGKTIVFAHVAKHFTSSGQRVLVLAHREELIRQARDKIAAVIPDIAICVEKASERANELAPSPVVVASVQTMVAKMNGSQMRRMHKFHPKQFGLIIIDEAHHAVARTYKDIVDYFRAGNPGIKVLGVTATADRLDGKALGRIYKSVAHNYEIKAAIDDGWLVPIKQSTVVINGISFSNIKTVAGDYVQSQLAQIMEEEKPLHGVASALMAEVGTRKTIVFAASVNQAERLCEIMNRPGNRPGSAGFVCGATKDEERKDTIRRYQEGELQFLFNVGIATEGFDDPATSCVAVARPTKSRALYTQMIGRGTRVLPGVVDEHAEDHPVMRQAAVSASGKPDMLVLDFTDNANNHKLVTSANILGGDFTDEEIAEANRSIADREEADPVDPLDELETARNRIKDRKARAKIIARAKYTASPNNPFSMLAMTPDPAPRYRNVTKPLSEKQAKMLEKAGVKLDQHTLPELYTLLDEVFRRIDRGLATLKQVAAIKKRNPSAAFLSRTFGVGDVKDLTKAQANGLMAQLSRNNWVTPPSWRW